MEKEIKRKSECEMTELSAKHRSLRCARFRVP